MPIKIGALAVLKATNEVVFVCNIRDMKPEPETAIPSELSGKEVVVRRPVVKGEAGSEIYHSLEVFLLDELETEEEARARQVANQFALQDAVSKFRKTQSNTVPAETEPDTSVN